MTVLTLALAAASGLTPAPDPSSIFGGTEVAACGWPNVVAIGGRCTGTLLHPRVVIYAAHCGASESVVFTENDLEGPSREVATRFCKPFPREEGELGRDFAYCILDEPQLDVPIVPPLMGCEVDRLESGAEVRVVGFGIDEEGVGGVKRELVTTFQEFENEEAFLSGGGDACIGDSGGPALLRIPDPQGGPDTWRAFGIVSHGDTDECAAGTYYGLMHVGMEWFETESDFDLTPCTDADGTWNPDARCDALPRSLDDLDGGWPEGCADAARGGAVGTCGEPVGAVHDGEPPSVVISTPSQDMAVDSEGDSGLAVIEIEAEADDPGGLLEVVLRIDGEPVPGGAQGLRPFTWAPAFPPGEFVVDVVARDHEGLEAISAPIIVAVDQELAGEDEDEDDEAGEDTDTDGEGCGCVASRRGCPPWLGAWLGLLLLAPRRRSRLYSRGRAKRCRR